MKIVLELDDKEVKDFRNVPRLLRGIHKANSKQVFRRMTKHIPFRVGDKVIASTRSREVGEIIATSTFDEVLIEWSGGRRFWTKRRHLLRATNEKT